MTVAEPKDSTEATLNDQEAVPSVEPRRCASLSAWLSRPAGFWISSALVVLILSVPAWLIWDELKYSALFGDDFSYIADALDWKSTKANLLKPHNTHVVPLFRLWTALIVASCGPYENLPLAFRVASYIGLIVTMLVVFRFVATETGRTALGLAAMASLGISTVVQPAVSWYSAGQALWAGAGIVVTLLFAREWSLKGGIGRLFLVAVASLAATGIWSGGLLAGPAATAYIIARHPSRSRGALLALGFVSILAVVILVVLSRTQISDNTQVWERHDELWPRPIQAVLHTFQAIAETMVLANLGLDAVTTPSQAVVLVVALCGIWLCSRGGLRGQYVEPSISSCLRREREAPAVPTSDGGSARASPSQFETSSMGRGINPLEASGAVMVVGSYLLVYFFRGNFPYSSLRGLGWYNAIPQVGTAIFAVGWWQSLRPGLARGLTRFEAIVVLGFVGVLCVLQVSRAERTLLVNAPALSAKELKLLPIPSLQRYRALYFKEVFLARQIRALARLEKADAAVAKLRVGPETLRSIYGRVLVPGIPEKQLSTDSFSLLRHPPEDSSRPVDIARVRFALDELLRPEIDPRPAWLEPDDPWPRP